MQLRLTFLLLNKIKITYGKMYEWTADFMTCIQEFFPPSMQLHADFMRIFETVKGNHKQTHKKKRGRLIDVKWIRGAYHSFTVSWTKINAESRYMHDVS